MQAPLPMRELLSATRKTSPRHTQDKSLRPIPDPFPAPIADREPGFESSGSHHPIRFSNGFVGFGPGDRYIGSYAAATDKRCQTCRGDRPPCGRTASARYHPFREPCTRHKSGGKRLRSSCRQRATAGLRRGLPTRRGTRTSMRRRSMHDRRMARSTLGRRRCASDALDEGIVLYGQP